MNQDTHGLINIPGKDIKVAAYIATRSGEKRPGLILIHEIWGLKNHIKDIADRLCLAGYAVVAPDLMTDTDMEKVIKPELQKALFDPEERAKYQVEIRALYSPLSSPEFSKNVIKKLQTVFDYLKNSSMVNKIGVIGFCFGGTYSFNFAIHQPELAAAVPFYGHCNHSDEEISKISCPVLAFYGDRDTGLMETLSTLERQMEKLGKNFQRKVYPGARHAFFNNTNPLTYNEAAAKDAWQETLTFLDTNLKTG